MDGAGGTARNPYAALGVRPFINCCAVRTVHGGSLMLPEVRAAVDAASRQFVNLDELMEAASARIAELTGAEWGIVTCGSAAAVALGTAACVAGNDPVKMLRLPFTEGWVNRVIMVKNQRFAYDQAIRMIGTRVVEVESIADLDAALGEPVAMICVLGTHEAQSRVRLEDLVSRAKPRGIPIMVDAASEHIEKPSPWLVRGADLVIYSGGKFLRGPQTSGLLLGNKALVQAAWRNASPHQAIGRPMKVSKEDIIGVLAALEAWFAPGRREREEARWRADVAAMAAPLAVPGVRTEVAEPAGVVRVPRLVVRWDVARVGLNAQQLRLRLLEGEPRIMIDDMAASENSVELDPFALQPGEAAEVGAALARLLNTNQPVAATEAAPAALADVSGTWRMDVRFLHGTRTHTLRLAQAGNAVSGAHEAAQFSGAVSGTLTGTAIDLALRDRYEGSTISYRLTGTVHGARMRGSVVLGSATDHHQGPVNLAQFGTGAFEAVRA
jgi:L-seryl-tRNA(Ser) seleniumtransferase